MGSGDIISRGRASLCQAAPIPGLQSRSPLLSLGSFVPWLSYQAEDHTLSSCTPPGRANSAGVGGESLFSQDSLASSVRLHQCPAQAMRPEFDQHWRSGIKASQKRSKWQLIPNPPGWQGRISHDAHSSDKYPKWLQSTFF